MDQEAQSAGMTCRSGIDTMGWQNELGEVVYVEMPEPGSEVEAGSTFGVVESVKAASDVYSPISGTVVEANSELTSSPGQVITTISSCKLKPLL